MELTSLVPIFNKMTVNSFRYFIDRHGVKLKTSVSKEDYKNNLREQFLGTPSLLRDFEQFYLSTEEAGKKHFFLYRFDNNASIQRSIDSYRNRCVPETQRVFDPSAEDEKVFYSQEDNSITFKFLKIRKIYEFMGENTSDTELVKKYSISIIHHVSFVKFDFSLNTIIAGIDSIGELISSADYEKEANQKIKLISKDISLSSVVTSDHIAKFMNYPNCLVWSLKNQIANTDQATFKKRRADIDDILSDLRHGKYKINEIKIKNPDYDIKTHLLYEASLAKSISDDFELMNDSVEFFYFTDATGKISCFRIKIDVVNSSIITYAESIAKEEIADVLQRVI